MNQVLQKVLDTAHQAGRSVVLVTGVFDILHEEHRRFLEKAKAAGDVLVIGVETDARVRQIKGEGRPVNPLVDRVAALEALNVADAVFALPEQFSRPEDHIALITAIKPAVLAVSSHTAHLDKKQKVLDLVGGQVMVVHQHNPAISTTQILADQAK